MSTSCLTSLAFVALWAIACGGKDRSEFIDPAKPVELPDGGMQVPERGPTGVTGSGSGGDGQICSKPGLGVQLSVTNGSFEQAVVSGDFLALSTGADELSGWKITGGSIEVIGTYWQHSDGNRSLDLNGTSAGTITTELKTEGGKNYAVSFYLAGNPTGGASVKQVRVSAASSAATYDFDTKGHTTSSMGWKKQRFEFVASSAMTTLRFQSQVSGNAGPALDEVSLSQFECMD